MSPTVNELYDKLVKPKAMEDAARAFYRQKNLEETLAKKRREAPVDERCAKHGHSPVGHWTEHTSPSGVTYQKCRTCKQGYVVTKVVKDAALEHSPVHEDFPTVPTQRFVHHVGSAPSPT